MKNNVLQTLSILFLAVCFMSVVSCDKNDDNYSDYDTSDGDVTYVAKDVFKLNGKTYYYWCNSLFTSYSFSRYMFVCFSVLALICSFKLFLSNSKSETSISDFI